VKFYISPSTQEHNVGVGKYGTEEKRMNEIADVVCKCLTASGVQYFRNRPEMTLGEVVRDSNSKKVDFHFAIHSNAGGGQGCEVHIFQKGGEAERFAKIVYSRISALTPVADRGIQVSPQLYEVNKTLAPTALIEVSFHDDSKDATFIVDHIHQIGVELAKGICEFAKTPFVNPYATASETVSKYKVQVGAFANLDNAKALLEEVKKAGFTDAFITK
jgi:N-acetylmuramoyl-L-alanine amidase